VKGPIVVKSSRISFFENLFVLMLILYGGMGNTFFVSLSYTENPIGLFLPVFLSVILIVKWKVKFDIQFCILIYLFDFYFFAVSIKYNDIHPNFFIIFLLKFFIVYAAIKALKFNLFIIYEKFLYYLAIIGLLMWGIQIVLGGDTLYDYFSKIYLIKSTSFVSSDGLNAIIYSVIPSSGLSSYNFRIPRNCGYAWEPGGFAVYICLALFINLFITNSNGNSKKRFWVLLLALVSTQSTTGYIIFTVLIIYYTINKRLNKVLLLLPIVITSLIFIFSLPFMKNKIIELFAETKTIDQITEQSIDSENSVNTQRFASFTIAFIDFRNNPILGLASHKEETWTYKLGANISTISGVGNVLAQYGIVGFLFFIISSIKSSFLFSKNFIYKGRFLLFLIILLISISYSIVLLPLMMSFWMFALFEYQETKEIGDKVLVFKNDIMI
jgi:hypothetical protein